MRLFSTWTPQFGSPLPMAVCALLLASCAQLTGLDKLEASEPADTNTGAVPADEGSAGDGVSTLGSDEPVANAPASDTSVSENDSSGATAGDTTAENNSGLGEDPADDNSSSETTEVAQALPASDDSDSPNPGSNNATEPLSVATSTSLPSEDLAKGDQFSSAGGFSRTWSTNSDGTGQMTPVEYTVMAPVDGSISVSGSGFAQWGAGLELRFDESTVTDLSAYQAVEMSVRGTGTLSFELLTTATTGVEGGGVCVSMNCWGHYFQDIELSEDAQLFRIDFSDLVQPDYADAVPLNSEQSLGFDFMAYLPFSGRPRDFEFTIERLSLIPR